jgi:hypothetical protein
MPIDQLDALSSHSPYYARRIDRGNQPPESWPDLPSRFVLVPSPLTSFPLLLETSKDMY